MEGGSKIEKKIEDGSVKLRISEDKETLERKDEFIKKENSEKSSELKTKASKLEKINSEIEETEDPESKKELFLEMEEIENRLDELEEGLKDLGFDSENIMALYEDLEEKDIAEAVEGDGAEEFVSDLVKGKIDDAKKIASEKGFNPAQVAILIACFLFLMIGAPNKSRGSERVKPGFETSQETEKSDIDKFLKKLEIVKVFQKQEFLDMKIPAKPKNCEEQDWEIQIFNNEGTTIGRFDVDDKLTYAVFGKGSEEKAQEAKLIIKEDGKVSKETKIKIIGQEEVANNEEDYQENIEAQYEKFLEKVKNEKDSRKRFGLILEELESLENTIDLKEKIKDYFKEEISDYAKSLRSLDDEHIKFAKDLFEEVFTDVSFSDSVGEELTDFIFEESMLLEEDIYKKATENLDGEKKLWKVSRDPFRYMNIVHKDSELVDVVKGRIEGITKMSEKEEIKNALGELSDFFEGTNFWKGSELESLQAEYNTLKSNLRNEERKDATEEYLTKAIKASN